MKKLIASLISFIILIGAGVYVYNIPAPEEPSPILATVSTPVIQEVDTTLAHLEHMTLEEKIGQMFLIGIFTENSNKILEQLITDKKIGSVILMNQNIAGLHVLDVTTHLQEIASSTHQIPLLISIDQEGGVVSRIKDTDSNLTSQPAISTSSQAYTVAFERGAELKRKGVNVNFSPVLEHITHPSSFLYTRVFRGSQNTIVSYGNAMVKGYRDAGILATIKHFPGHDNTSIDSHKNLPMSQIDSDHFLEHTRVFKEVIESENPPLVMTAHVLFPKIDSVYPATLSPTLISILRNDYNYSGVIITDDMNMGAIANNFGVAQSAVQALIAGNDILLYVATVPTITTAYDAVIKAVTTGVLSEERINESVYRILKLKEMVR